MQVPGFGSVPKASPAPGGSSPQPKKPQDVPELTPSQHRGEAPSADPGAESDDRVLRLAEIKAAIEAGEYETQDKLDAALSRLFEEIGLFDDEEETRLGRPEQGE